MKLDIHHAKSAAPTDEPPVRSPELARLVALAREQPIAPLRPLGADFERLHAGFVTARQGQRRRVMTIGGLALAAGLAGLALTRMDLGASRPTSPIVHVAQDMSEKPDSSGVAVSRGPVLAEGVRVVAQNDDTPSPTVLGPWEVGLAPGRYDVEVDPHSGPELLRARSAGGTVELHHGRVEIVVAASETHARLREGVATWTAPNGERTPLAVTPPATVATVTPDAPAVPAVPATPTAPTTTAGAPRVDGSEVRALARRAEALLTSGQRDAAIVVLKQIVTRHPHEPAARSALLDLAPLLKAAGRPDESRCAYRLYLDRYRGKAQLAGDVSKALGRLGDGPECDGLTPR